MEANLKKNTIWNIVGTGINAFASLIFMIIVTRINDVDEAGIFSFAFAVATLFNVIGTYAGRIYQVTERKKIFNKDFFVNRLISCAIMYITAIIFVAIRSYELEKIIIIMLLCFWKMLEAFCDVIYAFLQKDDELYKVGISLTLKNVIGLTVFLIVEIITKNLIISIIAFIIIFLIITITYDLVQAKIKKQLKGITNKTNVVSIFKSGFPTFCVTFLNIYIINASKYAIDSIMTDNYQTIFGIIVMPATMMILIAQFMVHPFLNIITEYIKNNNYKSLNKFLIKITLLLVIISIVAVIFCYFIGIYILEFIYGISLIDYNICLSIILIGALFSALTAVITTILIAMRHTVVQMVVYIIMSIIAFITSNILVSKYGIMGASINYSLIMILICMVFYIVYKIIVRKDKKRIDIEE